MKVIKLQKNLIYILGILLFIVFSAPAKGKILELRSPDKKIKLQLFVDSQIQISIHLNEQVVLEKSPISLEINGILKSPIIKTHSSRSIQEQVVPVVPTKNAEIQDHYNELSVEFQGNYSLKLRVYNSGVAYRFQTSFKKEIVITGEKAEYNFPESHPVYFPEEESFFSHNERAYLLLNLAEIPEESFCSLPMLLAPENGTRILITESDIQDYPGMWLKGTSSNSLHAILPHASAEETQENDRNVKVTKRESFLAKTKGSRNFPWRVFIIGENDKSLLENELVYCLASPGEIENTSWIKAGKVAWDWWNNLNVYGVDFISGLNTDTYKYYIDFASDYGIEYIVLDEGWYELGDLFDINPDINMEELFAYAKKKNVGIILWVIWKTLDDQLEEALNQFAEWGAVGIKVDFMQRDDQWMVNYYWKISREAAKRELLVDFHGAYKPSGLRRTYPNVLTREGLRGLEWNKWSDVITPTHNLTIPFIRMVAGPMDYTPGAMVNAHKDNFTAHFSRPMSQGTRVHQMAMYVVYESPLQMLADNPSNYKKEEECTRFITGIPVTWDETIVLEAKIGEYILIARRKKDDWFVAAMNNETEIELKLDLSFLKNGKYSMQQFQDGVNANKYASDYSKSNETVTNNSTINIKLAGGGGWTSKIQPLEEDF
ncbi:MAG: glycoside hydrolase family 97 protein [Bacteroidota bacterium]|nr:glycoside hydrolase family 97 protein [Bacteroidota bacterium]